jgi:isopenicillin N synthase-like dioxygenase
MELPVIDISCWNSLQSTDKLNEDHRKTALEWDDAMKKFGFAIIIGHGIGDATFDQLLNQMTHFFEKPVEEKMVFNHGYYGHPCGGYTPPGYETVGLSTGEAGEEKHKPKYDPVENFVFTSSPETFCTRTGESIVPFPLAPSYYQSMNNLLHTLHRLSASALQLTDLEYFQRFYDPKFFPNENMGKDGNCLRLARYPGNDEKILHSNEGLLVLTD